ncbi:alpha/beta hydrolase fold domain-containing protein [Trichoderma breve]|uniref:Alpha/beta hydrolase fold domain-containing protein n=1 Tax=Trichoderma breve TaxID=2034170 RepID=A0A9W9B8U9_9HYPO|nr:alpha/beta hydrolase fold domain-containing protein [Trichoderma breve]KAJ4858077.1 alpha/beta hydrolase fold domain-containing protein [Trichoderma breve]
MSSETPESVRSGAPAVLHKPPPLTAKILYSMILYAGKSLAALSRGLQGLKEVIWPPNVRPDLIKTYQCRPHLPVRIFLPASHDASSLHVHPVLFVIVGGGWFMGYNKEHDEWNRAFAHTQSTIVIGLDHSKAPRTPFPGPVHDIEALMLAALADETIPIDRSSHYTTNRVAILGFASGAAVMCVAGVLDLSITTEGKLENRYYKPALKPSKRGGKDSLGPVMPALCWGYVPYGVDLCNPLLSPGYADLSMLPAHVCLVGAELDFLAHEAWRLACRLSREGAGVDHGTPDPGSRETQWRIVGQEQVHSGNPLRGLGEGVADERFAFEEHWQGGGVKWLLVPDVLHGFDNRFYREMDTHREDIRDAEVKTEAYMRELGTWLRERVWRL